MECALSHPGHTDGHHSFIDWFIYICSSFHSLNFTEYLEWSSPVLDIREYINGKDVSYQIAYSIMEKGDMWLNNITHVRKEVCIREEQCK